MDEDGEDDDDEEGSSSNVGNVWKFVKAGISRVFLDFLLALVLLFDLV